MSNQLKTADDNEQMKLQCKRILVDVVMHCYGINTSCTSWSNIVTRRNNIISY